MFASSSRALPSPIALAAALLAPALAAAAPPLPPLPHTVGMSGPDVALIDRGIAAFDRGDAAGARDDFRRALAIRDRTAIANFDLGVADVRLGARARGEGEMRRGFALANAHGMAASPQAAAMRTIASDLGIALR